MAREARKQRSYKALRRKRTCPATRRGLMGVTWGKYVGGCGCPGCFCSPGPANHLDPILILDFRFGLGGGLGLGGVGASLGVLPREGYQGTVPKPWAPVEDQSPPRTSGEVPLMERPKPAQNPGAREVAPAPVVPGKPRRVWPGGMERPGRGLRCLMLLSTTNALRGDKP